MPTLQELYNSAQKQSETLQIRWANYSTQYPFLVHTGLPLASSTALSTAFTHWMAYSFYLSLGASLFGGILGLGLYRLGQAAFDTYRKIHQILDHVDQTIVNTNRQIKKLDKTIVHLNKVLVNMNTKVDAMGETLANADETLVAAQNALGNVQDAAAPFSLPSRATKGFFNLFKGQPASLSEDEDEDEDLNDDMQASLDEDDAGYVSAGSQVSCAKKPR